MASGLIIGIDLGGTNIRSGLVRGGELVALDSRPTPADATQEVVLDAVLESVEEVLDRDVVAHPIGLSDALQGDQGLEARFQGGGHACFDSGPGSGLRLVWLGLCSVRAAGEAADDLRRGWSSS